MAVVGDLVADPPSSWMDVGATAAMGGSGCGGGGERLGHRSTIVVDGCGCSGGDGRIWVRRRQ